MRSQQNSNNASHGSNDSNIGVTDGNVDGTDALSACAAEFDPIRKRFESAKGLYSKLFEEATISSVDPLRCISIKKLRSRPFCKWGVQMIRDAILGQPNVDTFVKGFISTGKFGVLAEIPSSASELIVEHFMDEGKTEEEARTLADSGPWYHVVDGGHLHLALMQIIHEFSENFAGFRWPVAVIAWKSDETLRAVGRMCNEMQQEAHYIDFPLPNAMKSLRDIVEAHSKNTGIAVLPGEKVAPGFIKKVMEIYSGCSGYSSKTMRIVCGIVLKMSAPFVTAMSTLLTEECYEYWKSLGSKRPHGQDTRIYKKLISSQSLKCVPTFLDHKTMSDEDRINVIHRLRFLARERESFKAFQSAEIEAQSRCVLAARIEVDKFDEFLGEEVWPTEMENMRRNMFQTTLLDGDIREHVGADKQLLPAMIAAYLKATCAHGSQKLGQFKRRIDMQEVGGNEEVVGISGCRKNPRNGSQCPSEADGCALQDQEVVASGIDNLSLGNQCQDNQLQLEGSSVAEGNFEADSTNIKEPNAILDQCGITVENLKLLESERISVDIDRTFDFVISDPFQKVPSVSAEDENKSKDTDAIDELVDEKGITMYLQCLRRLLAPVSFCFVFLVWDRLHTWATCSRSSQLEVVCEPFMVMKDPGRVQKMTTKGLQSIYDPALVLKKPGKHPSGFEIDKVSSYAYLPMCRIPRWCNVIDGVPPPSQRLTFKPSRVHVRPNERSCALFIELFQTFCLAGGTVLDPLAGALTTELACIATNRRCVILETDGKCLSYAMHRLRDFAKSKLAENNSTALLMGDTVDENLEEEIRDGEDDVQCNISAESIDHMERGNISTDIATTDVRTSVLTDAGSIGPGRDESVSKEENHDSDRERDNSPIRDGIRSPIAHETSSKKSHVKKHDSCEIESVSLVTSVGSQSHSSNSLVPDDSRFSRRGFCVSEESPVLTQKRNRAVRRLMVHAGTNTGISPASACRQSKRSRKPATRYAC